MVTREIVGLLRERVRWQVVRCAHGCHARDVILERIIML
jgi:hypothetical protein